MQNRKRQVGAGEELIRMASNRVPKRLRRNPKLCVLKLCLVLCQYRKADSKASPLVYFTAHIGVSDMKRTHLESLLCYVIAMKKY